uniref:Charged multivesicular body protein 6 n=1 Tax=Globodera pallida TaxID=36090 RepID=A0A183CRA6_GLOPA
MGNLFTSRNKPNRPAQAVTDHDRTTLSLKMQRDKLRQACQRYERNVAKDAERARALLRDGRKDRALLLLKRKRYQETMINRVSGYIEQVEQMITDVEMARINKDVFDNLRLGNEALKALNETISLDEVERIMEEGREAQEFQEELSTILGQCMSEEDSELVEEEFERMLSEQLPAVPTSEPTAATGEAETRRTDGGKEPKRRREAVALETS